MAFAIALGDEQWELVADLFDPPGRRGAPAVIPRRQMVDAMLFIGRTGIQWRYLPERYGTWTAVWAQWRRWRANGVWAAAMTRLVAVVRWLHEREPLPSMVMVDAQTVKGARYGPTFHATGGRGGRTIGTKRTLLIEILGLPVAAAACSARPHDVTAARELLHERIDGLPRLRAIVGGRAYRGLTRLAARKHVALDIKAPPPGTSGFVPIRRPGLMSSLELDRRKHAKRRVTALAVVEDLEVDASDEDRSTRQGAEAAQRAVARGRELAGSAGGIGGLPRETRVALLAALGAADDAALQEDRAADIVRLSREALEIADGLGEEARLAALMRTAFPFWTLGQWREAEERFREAWALSHRLILPMSMIEAGLGFSRVLHRLGRIDEAQAIATETNALEARIRPWRHWDTSQAVLHMIEELSRRRTRAAMARRRRR